MRLSARAESLSPSLTLSIIAKAARMRAEGHDICSLSAGEPDFDTPGFICDAAVEALRQGKTRYGPAAGEPALRCAIAAKLYRDNRLDTNSQQVLVTNGGKQALFNLFQVLLGPGDEALIPAPYWLSYPEMARLAGARFTVLPTRLEDGFCLDPDQLEAAIGPDSRLLVLNSPGNPGGNVYDRGQLQAIASVLRQHPQVLVVSDEIYEHIIYADNRHHSLPAVAPDLASRCFVVNGFAKGWAMTGWRVGYLAGDADVIAKAAALQSQSTSNVCTFAQYGALAALEGLRDCIRTMLAAFAERRAFMLRGLAAFPQLKLSAPRGAFYLFPDISATGMDSISFCDRLLQLHKVAVVPGIAFGDDRCVRLSFASDTTNLMEGLRRLGAFLGG
ncbi:MAG: pyridoxal phosphate-dependent aminotransferase [Aphanocapsa feldmannii 277cV]|uniref:Aminotransferase n=2 Tax=Aphanocapsa feldmannii TaxID=192050 RepID=A0A524RPX9_9CHRO|nr:MAG: pyridoxal phosphate-dependent aminotransferase [Aphanocapsa feldmannii 277cV]